MPESNGSAFRHDVVDLPASWLQPELISPTPAPEPELELESEQSVREGDADVVRAGRRRAALRAFYKEHVPEKSDNEVEAILAKYAGREAKLLAKVQKKYLADGSTNAEQPQPQPQNGGDSRCGSLAELLGRLDLCKFAAALGEFTSNLSLLVIWESILKG
eukprot:COSAG04_NODE_405_length_14870_cov_4.008666_13_plen_161_part_00